MKIIAKNFILSSLLVVFLFSLLACASNDNGEWESIAQYTIAETTKADANYKTSWADGLISITDGNKFYSNNTYYVFEDGKLFDINFSTAEEIWQKVERDRPVYSTMGDYAFGWSGLSSIDSALNNLDNVQYLGKGIYSYHEYGHYYSSGFVNEPDTYKFIVINGLVTKIESTVYGGSGILMFRNFVCEITYGGQTVNIPNDVIMS